MPSFAGQLNETAALALADYLRERFGPKANEP